MNLTDCGPQGSGDCSMEEMADNTQRGDSLLMQVSLVTNGEIRIVFGFKKMNEYEFGPNYSDNS